MLRSLLTPRWLLLHVLFIVLTIATGFLAVWQWDRAHEAGGSFQNLGYALQWPLFGVFTIFLWIRMARMELGRLNEDDSAAEATGGSTDVDTTVDDSGDSDEQAPQRKRPLVPPPAPQVDPEEDPELAEYNRYLAQLNEIDKS